MQTCTQTCTHIRKHARTHAHTHVFHCTFTTTCSLHHIMITNTVALLVTISICTDSEPTCCGSPLSDIHLGSCTTMTLPALRSSGDHAVLFQTRDNRLAGIPRPYPEKFRDVWDSNHVKMPCSQRSVYPVAVPGRKDKVLQPRWEMIRQALSKPINNSYDLEEAIMTYNSRYSKKWNFSGLHTYFSNICRAEESFEFFTAVLPQLIVLALELPHLVTHAVPLLKKQQDYSLTMTQQQVACLLANAFLCTFPLRNSSGPTSEYFRYPSINFSSLYSQNTTGRKAWLC